MTSWCLPRSKASWRKVIQSMENLVLVVTWKTSSRKQQQLMKFTQNSFNSVIKIGHLKAELSNWRTRISIWLKVGSEQRILQIVAPSSTPSKEALSPSGHNLFQMIKYRIETAASLHTTTETLIVIYIWALQISNKTIKKVLLLQQMLIWVHSWIQ